MRDKLNELIDKLIKKGQYPDHAGLYYDIYAPLNQEFKLDEQKRDDWFKHLEHIGIPEGYKEYLIRWVSSLEEETARQKPFKRCYRSKSRLLIGHGNASPTEVGLTLHRTWGVPMIPGSSLKGLLAHYLETAYGPDGTESTEEEKNLRKPYGGPASKDGVGEFYKWLFGAAGTEDKPDEAERGHLVIYDALWVPGNETQRIPLARDILTVHQKDYYRTTAPEKYPNDYDDPNPVSFISVGPGARFMMSFMLIWTEKDRTYYAERETIIKRVERYLDEALGQWGIGGKTSSGYGRMEPCSCELPKVKRVVPASIRAFETWLEEQTKAGGVSQQELVGKIDSEWGDRLKPMVRGREREEVLKTLRKHIKKGNARDAWEALIQKWSA